MWTIISVRILNLSSFLFTPLPYLCIAIVLKVWLWHIAGNWPYKVRNQNYICEKWVCVRFWSFELYSTPLFQKQVWKPNSTPWNLQIKKKSTVKVGFLQFSPFPCSYYLDTNLRHMVDKLSKLCAECRLVLK